MTDSILFELFDIKQKFLREIPHPKLILKQIKKIEMNQGYNAPRALDYSSYPLTKSNEELTLVQFLDEHIHAGLGLKHQISLSNTYDQLKDSLAQLIDHQVQLMRKLKTYLPFMDSYPDQEIKQSKPLDPYAVLKLIQKQNLKENEIKNYLCILLKAGEENSNTLLEACLQANKILGNG